MSKGFRFGRNVLPNSGQNILPKTNRHYKKIGTIYSFGRILGIFKLFCFGRIVYFGVSIGLYHCPLNTSAIDVWRQAMQWR